MSCMAALVPPQELHSTAFQAMSVVSGACWIITYALIIRRGYLDRSYGMPIVAVCVNISWEFVFTFLIPHERPQNYINAGWLLLDLFIFAQLLLFWRSDYRRLDEVIFYPFAGSALLASFGLIYTMATEFDRCGAYSAFGQNFLMSILFMIMLFQRNSLMGQSVYIALVKLAGTALASLAAWLFVPLAQQSAVLKYLFLAILFFDMSYVAAICYLGRKERISVWRRL
jgi:drug/metabolite transporter superfamily protein YnfA